MSNPSSYLLAVDVGNSRIKFGLFDRSRSAIDEDGLPRCLHATAVAVTDEIPWDEIRHWIDDGDAVVTGVVAGANPAGISTVVGSWPTNGWHPPRVIDDVQHFPLTTHVESPAKVGIDRLLNAIAANVVRARGCAAIIVDTGTATTVDLVAADGAFAGGAILPGFELSALSLHHYTALLPLISVEELAASDREPLGRDTPTALYSGLFWGQLGAVKELITRLTATCDDGSAGASPSQEPQSITAAIFLTGGGAELLADHLPHAQWLPHLSLQGLVIAAENLRERI